jgi:hypothetical protein
MALGSACALARVTPIMPDACQCALAVGQFSGTAVASFQDFVLRLWRRLKLSPFIPRI